MHVRPMTKADVKRLEKWKYGGVYAYYDVDGIGEELLAADAQLLCFGPFTVAYYCFGKEARIPVGEKLLAYTETDCLDIALSMRPCLCGHGWGGKVLARGMAFARESMGAQRFRRLNKLLARTEVHSFESLAAILRIRLMKLRLRCRMRWQLRRLQVGWRPCLPL